MNVIIEGIEEMTVDQEGTLLKEVIADEVRQMVRTALRKLIKEDPAFAKRIDDLARKAVNV
jgi:hypothetical protein